MQVQVVYASKTEQVIRSVFLSSGATVRHAIEASKLLLNFSEINLSVNRVGVFGQLAKLDNVVEAGDRVEIYRPLEIDPKQARLLRAAKG